MTETTEANIGEADATKETGRLEAFSDGVFGIALTLLVLELKVPHPDAEAGARTSGALWSSLGQEWPSYFAYTTSFISILIMWVHHHTVFKLVQKTDSLLLFANGFLLLVVTIVPFPTAVLADYLMTPAAPAACMFYAGTFVVISSAYCLLLLAAFREKLLAPHASTAKVTQLRRSYRLGPPLYLVALVAAAFNVWLCIGICTCLWVFWAITIMDSCEM